MVGRLSAVRMASGAAGALVLALAGGGLAVVPALASAQTVTFASTDSEQTFTVPADVTALSVTLVGAPGAAAPAGGSKTGGSGGAGARVTAYLSVTPGQVLEVEVGGAGAVTAAGFNGGGAGGAPTVGVDAGHRGSSGGGGGATDIRTISCGTHSQCVAGGVAGSLGSRLIVAGGGGGGGAVSFGTYAANGAGSGGSGGSTQGLGDAGSPGANTNASAGGGVGGGGGTLAAGGLGGAQGAHSYPGGPSSTAGASGKGGIGGRNLSNAGGGGGGGYYGGGGGGAGGDDFNFAEGGGAGGGGGSSWAGSTAAGASLATDTTHIPLVQIAYTVPTKVSLTASAVPGSGGESETLTATVTESQAGDPTGTVQFLVDGRDYGNPVPLSNNLASITVTSLGPGAHTFGARYAGAAGFADASASLTVVVVVTPFTSGPAAPTSALVALLVLGMVLVGGGVAVAAGRRQ